MHLDLFNKILQVEAEMLYSKDVTPEIFVDRIKPLIQKLLKENGVEVMSENDLEKILSSANPLACQENTTNKSYFDVVDLCLYRAN